MPPAVSASQWPLLLNHASVGASTGYMADARNDWPSLARKAAEISTDAVELSALSEPELAGLLRYLESTPHLPFRYVSVHAPSKQRAMPERDLVSQLRRLSGRVDAIVVHPDAIDDVSLYRSLGHTLAIENMDSRKPFGQTADQLAALFDELPSAGLCFDVAHAMAVDPTLTEARRILRRFGDRLRQVHVSSLDIGCHHVQLTSEDREIFAPVLAHCRDVPWILEAQPPGS